MDDLISRSKLLDTIDQNARFYGLTSANKLNFMDIVRRQEAVYAEPKWISVEDRLPPPNENVLYYEKGSEIDVMPSEWIREQYYEGYYKIYWMPRPEPPKEG